MGCNEKSIFWFCLIATLALSLTAVAMALPRAALKFSFDYQGVFVGIFAALVTLLIGAQIFNHLDINRQIDKANKQVADTLKHLNELDKKLERQSQLNYSLFFVNCGAMSFLQGRMNRDTERLRNNITSYFLIIHALKYLLRTTPITDETDYVLNFCNNFLETLTNDIETALTTNRATVHQAFTSEKVDKANKDFKAILTHLDTIFQPNQDKILALHNRYLAIKGQLAA